MRLLVLYRTISCYCELPLDERKVFKRLATIISSSSSIVIALFGQCQCFFQGITGGIGNARIKVILVGPCSAGADIVRGGQNQRRAQRKCFVLVGLRRGNARVRIQRVPEAAPLSFRLGERRELFLRLPLLLFIGDFGAQLLGCHTVGCARIRIHAGTSAFR